MKLTKPKSEDYNLTLEQLKKYKIQTLEYEYIIQKPYIKYFSIMLFLTLCILNNNFIFNLLNSGIAGFDSLIYIIPITIAVFYIITIISLGLFSTILKILHPLTKNVKQYTEAVNQYNIKLKNYEEKQERLKKDFWYSLTGHQFEYEVAKLFKEIGFKTEVTKGSDDKGIDINMWNKDKYIIVQCKAHKRKLSPAILRELYGTMIAHNANEAYLITLEGISNKSQEFIVDKPIKVFDVKNLISIQKILNNDIYS